VSAAEAGSAAGEAGGARPQTGAPAARLGLVQLRSDAFRCPYCGSSDTRLDNIFGPTPCRSLRHCETCRQPFEQFKTI
jgi:ring-1,2-phenylacetyl-CoA epoxidase subunit PaaD